MPKYLLQIFELQLKDLHWQPEENWQDSYYSNIFYHLSLSLAGLDFSLINSASAQVKKKINLVVLETFITLHDLRIQHAFLLYSIQINSEETRQNNNKNMHNF